MEAPDDPCTKDWCEQGVCKRKVHEGQGLVPEGDAVRLLQGQYEIGPLSLETDNANFYLGFWARSDGTGQAKVTVRRHDANPNSTAIVRTLDQVHSELTTVYSSPALAPTTSGLRVAVAARSANQDGMHLLTLKSSDLTTAGTLERVDFGTYSSFPSVVTRPQIGMNGTTQVVAWTLDGAVRLRRWTGSNTDFFTFGSADTVSNLVPISGSATQAFGAVMEASIGASDKLMVWKEGESTLATEFDSEAGARLGLASTPLEADVGGPYVSLVAWAHVTDDGRASLKLGSAGCTAATCTAESFQAPGIVSTEGMRPAIAVRRENASDTLRRLAFLYAAHAKGSTGTTATSVLVLNLFRLDLDDLNAEVAFEDLAYNPPISLVTTPDLAAPANPLESPFRSTAIAITPGGSIMMAWVYREEGGTASLWIRRYRLNTCMP
jgi:hypothetical protein